MSQITLFFLKQQQKQQGKHEEGEENDDDSRVERKKKQNEKWMSMKFWRDIHLVIPAVCDLQRLITF